MSKGDRRWPSFDALERLTKWRTVFAGWQLGTRSKDDPEGAAVRDHREVTMILRAEVTALYRVLIEKGLITSEDYDNALWIEAEALSQSYSKRFPGMAATDAGIVLTMPEAAETMKNWRP